MIDFLITCLGDSNIRVATLALQVLRVSLSAHSTSTAAKLGSVLPSVFLLLGDKRPHVKEHANELLASVRTAFDPPVITSALCPRIAEVPDRIKTAVLQYLGVTVPYCEAYFSLSSNMSAFLIRMANVLGAQGGKPSATLQASGERLLRLVYNVAKQVSFLNRYIIKVLIIVDDAYGDSFAEPGSTRSLKKCSAGYCH